MVLLGLVHALGVPPKALTFLSLVRIRCARRGQCSVRHGGAAGSRRCEHGGARQGRWKGAGHMGASPTGRQECSPPGTDVKALIWWAEMRMPQCHGRAGLTSAASIPCHMARLRCNRARQNAGAGCAGGLHQCRQELAHGSTGQERRGGGGRQAVCHVGPNAEVSSAWQTACMRTCDYTRALDGRAAVHCRNTRQVASRRAAAAAPGPCRAPAPPAAGVCSCRARGATSSCPTRWASSPTCHTSWWRPSRRAGGEL